MLYDYRADAGAGLVRCQVGHGGESLISMLGWLIVVRHCRGDVGGRDG